MHLDTLIMYLYEALGLVPNNPIYGQPYISDRNQEQDKVYGITAGTAYFLSMGYPVLPIIKIENPSSLPYYVVHSTTYPHRFAFANHAIFYDLVAKAKWTAAYTQLLKIDPTNKNKYSLGQFRQIMKALPVITERTNLSEYLQILKEVHEAAINHQTLKEYAEI